MCNFFLVIFLTKKSGFSSVFFYFLRPAFGHGHLATRSPWSIILLFLYLLCPLLQLNAALNYYDYSYFNGKVLRIFSLNQTLTLSESSSLYQTMHLIYYPGLSPAMTIQDCSRVELVLLTSRVHINRLSTL